MARSLRHSKGTNHRFLTYNLLLKTDYFVYDFLNFITLVLLARI